MTTEDFLTFIRESPSPFHVVDSCRKRLKAAGFCELAPEDDFNLVEGGRYFLPFFGSTLLAFTIGKRNGQLRLAAAHTDFPCLRLKPCAGIHSDGYDILNVEPYGGLILRSWLDRPLSLAGKVVLRGRDAFHPVTQLVNFTRPVAVIPSLAIHFDRDVNDRGELNCQKDMLPLTALAEERSDGADFFLIRLAQELNVAVDDISAYELSAYPVESGCVAGLDDQFLIAPRLDNLTSVWANLLAVIDAPATTGIRLAAFFDNEEVGSRTKQGAGSVLLRQVLELIYRRLGRSLDELWRDLQRGFMLSADVAHAVHPHHIDKSDPVVKPVLGGGVVLKRASAQTYVGDAEAVAIAKSVAETGGVAWQTFVNRADQKGGSTLGAIASSLLPVRAMDIGAPILAMHSAVETMAWRDQLALNEFVRCFFAIE